MGQRITSDREELDMIDTVRPRSAVRESDTWDLASIFPGDAAWTREMEAIGKDLGTVDRFRGRLDSGPAFLLEWMKSRESLQLRLEKVLLYARLNYHQDTGNSTAAARNGQASSVHSQGIAALSFSESEILELGRQRIDDWVRQEPGLAVYAHYFDLLFRRAAHVRSAEVEEVLNQVRDPFSNAAQIHGSLTDADLSFRPATTGGGERVEIAQGNYPSLITSADRRLRQTAWESYSDAHLGFQNTIADCLATGVRQNVFMARARKYGSSLEASLGPDNIPVEVFHNLIAVFRKRLPVWHRYWRLRRKAFGYDTLHGWDIAAPLTDTKPEIPFDQSVEWISEGMAPLGDPYVSTMRRGLLEQRWVDRYPNQGKRSGAYSSGLPGTHPFILMSYGNDIFGLSTLAHELGHSMHSWHTWQNQPPIYSEYTNFVGEVASNFNQALVRAHILERNADPEFQIAVLAEAMANFHRYLFLMPTLARFEHALHEKVERNEGLSASGLIGLMADLFAEGYGEEVVMDRDRIGITWAQFPIHMYLNFYVFQYATGISAAHALAEGVREGRPKAVENYLAFLKAGNSLYPLEALKLAGVDMTTTGPVERAFDVLERTVERLEELVERRR
jgi:oligoendopeptidase F